MVFYYELIRVENLKLPSQGFILDGFPRTLEQAVALDKLYQVDAAYHLTLREDVLIKKLSFRRVCRTCGKVWSTAILNEQFFTHLFRCRLLISRT